MHAALLTIMIIGSAPQAWRFDWTIENQLCNVVL